MAAFFAFLALAGALIGATAGSFLYSFWGGLAGAFLGTNLLVLAFAIVKVWRGRRDRTSE